MFQLRVKIVVNKKAKGNYFHCVFNAPQIAKEARPGQFVNIRVSAALDPLLRRPISIHAASGPKIEILYKVVGKSTQILSEKKPGDYLDILGPSGNGFEYEEPGAKNQKPILVGGGMGVAPLMFLAKAFKGNKPLVLIGAKAKDHIYCENEFKKLGCEVKISTDDGSKGFNGKVTDLLKKVLPLAMSNKPLVIYACGPRPMLKEIARISKEKGIPAQISLEEHMACGIGACLGCVADTIDGYKRVCKDGPVFDAGKIIFREAG